MCNRLLMQLLDKGSTHAGLPRLHCVRNCIYILDAGAGRCRGFAGHQIYPLCECLAAKGLQLQRVLRVHLGLRQGRPTRETLYLQGSCTVGDGHGRWHAMT